MTTDMKSALDGARLVKFGDSYLSDTVMVWHGGHTINVFSTVGGDLQATDCFSLSYDHKPERCEAEEAMTDMFAEYRRGLELDA